MGIMWGLVEFFQLRDWKILGRMIKELFGLKHIYTLFKNGMAILPCDKLLICSFHWFVHACQIKTAIYTSARTHTHTKSIFGKIPFLWKPQSDTDCLAAQTAVKYQCHGWQISLLYLYSVWRKTIWSNITIFPQSHF